MNSTECQLQRSHLWEKAHLLNFPPNKKPPPSEGARYAQLPDIREQVESASDAYAAAVEITRTEDEIGWRQLVKRIKPSAFNSVDTTATRGNGWRTTER